MRKRKLVVALLLFAACRREPMRDAGIGAGRNRISNVSTSIQSSGGPNTPMRYTIEVAFTMPDAYRATLGPRDVTMTDESGRSWPSRQTVTSENDESQRITMTFEPTEGAHIAVVHINDLDVDMKSGRVTRRKPAA
jgi:hypothetical protein